MNKLIKFAFVVAIAAVAGYNVYQSQSVMNGMSDFALANVEALASSSEKGPHWTGYAYNNIKNCCEYVGRYWSECSGAFDACKE